MKARHFNFIMYKKGRFLPDAYADNQCHSKGKDMYWYSIKIVFSDIAKLDEQGFLFDNALLDKCIEELNLIGSCEEMLVKICDCLYNFLKNYHVIGFRVNIESAPGVISMTRVCVIADFNTAATNFEYQLLIS